MNHSNDNGSAGGIFTLVAIFLLAGMVFVINGYALDKLTAVANGGMFAAVSATQMRYDVFNLMVMVFRFQPILVLISLGLNRLLSANMQFSEQTPLSSLTYGVVEMIFLTIVIMAFTMFGGTAIDAVVSTVTSIGMGDPSIGYELIQFIPSIFYGMMFLALVGICIQFVLECVQVADHSNSFTQSN